MEAWLEDAWHSRSAPFDKDVINSRDALKALLDAGAPRQMTVQSIGGFLKKERIGGGDLGKPRVKVDDAVKQVRLWAVHDFKEIAKQPVEVIDMCFQGEPWRLAVTKVNNDQAVIERKKAEEEEVVARIKQRDIHVYRDGELKEFPR